MRLTIILTIVSLFQVTASSYSQNTRLNLKFEKETLEKVFQEIEKKSEFSFFYKNELAQNLLTVDGDFKNASISEILNKVLASQNLSYIIRDKLILIIPKDFDVINSIQQQKISGTVTDASSAEPLPGVNITVEGTTIGTITDADGKYTIDLPSQNAVLIFSFVGYISEKIDVNNRTNIDVALVLDITKLEEVVVVGYGTMRKSDLTGAVVSVNSDKLKNAVTNSFDQALQGRAAGVQVTSNSGQPGAATSVRIRGTNSLQRSSEPLYVIDGVQVTGDNVSTLGFNFAGGGGGGNAYTTNPLSSINPSDIESIEVLKDASACAIYGNRGANGVILVTTKKGVANEAKISYEYNTGWKSLAKKIDVLSLQEYAQFQNELFPMLGKTPRADLADPSSLTGGTDWQDEVFQVARNTKHQLSLSGGTDKTTYYLSAGYQYDEGIVVNSWFERYNIRLNLENQTRKWLKVGTNLNIGRSNTKLAMAETNDGPIMGAIMKAPDVPVYNPDGSFAGPTFEQVAASQYFSFNPVGITKDRDTRQKKVNLLTNTYAELKWKNFTLRNEIGANIDSYDDYAFSARVKYGEFNIKKNQLLQRAINTTNVEIKNILNYTGAFNEFHNVNFMMAHEVRMGNGEELSASRSNFLSNNANIMSNGDPDSQSNGGFYYAPYRSESYLGRFFYNYADLAMLTASYRLDGIASKFREGKKWGAFPAVSAAFRLSNLDFFKSNVSSVSNLKINASYGETGNSNINDFAYLSSIYFSTTTLGQGAFFTYPALDITWETTRSANLGLELGLFENHIALQLEVYKKKTIDALNNINLPSFLGSKLGTVIGNAASIENKGLEITLSTVNFSGEFNWKTDFTFTRNKNKVLSLGEGGLPITGYGGQFGAATSYTVEGGPVGRFYGWETDGLYQNLDDIITSARWANNINAIKPNDKTGIWLGDIKFKDIDQTTRGNWNITGYTGTVVDGKYVPGTAVYTGNSSDVIRLTDVSLIDDKDRTFIGDPNPKFTFAINNTFSYKSWDATIFINGSYGNDILNYNKLLTEAMFIYNVNQSATVLDRAKPTLNAGGNPNNPADYTLVNPNSSVPRMRGDDNMGRNRLSSRYIEDGSYIRIQNVTIGYTLPRALVQKINLGSLRVYANIQNLATFTKYTGFDPEIGSTGQSALLQGIDNGHYPLSRMVLIGAQVNF